MSLTNQDKKWIEEQDNKVLKQLIAYVDTRFYSVEQKLARIDNLPTKEEFYDLADKILTSNKKVEIELTALSSIVSNHEDRVYKIEKNTMN